jgi:hypothetical protein
MQDPEKFTQIGIFGLNINHLATLLRINPSMVLHRSASKQIRGCNVEPLRKGLTKYKRVTRLNYSHSHFQGCQIVYFITKNPNFSQF